MKCLKNIALKPFIIAFIFTGFIFNFSCGGGGSSASSQQTPTVPTRASGWGVESKFWVGSGVGKPMVKFTPTGKGYALWTDASSLIWLGSLISDDTWSASKVNFDSFNSGAVLIDFGFDNQENPIIVWKSTDAFSTQTIRSRRFTSAGWDQIQDLISVPGSRSILDAALISGNSGRLDLIISKSEIDYSTLITLSSSHNVYMLNNSGAWGNPTPLKSSYVPEPILNEVMYPPIEFTNGISPWDDKRSIVLSNDGDLYFFWTQYYVYGTGEGSQWFAHWNPTMSEMEVFPVDRGSNMTGATKLALRADGVTATLVWTTDVPALTFLKTCDFSKSTGMSSTYTIDQSAGWNESLSAPHIISFGSKIFAFWTTYPSATDYTAPWKLKASYSTGVSDWSISAVLDQKIATDLTTGFLPKSIVPRQDGNLWLAGNYQGVWTRICSPSLSVGPIAQLPEAVPPKYIQEGPALAAHQNGTSIIAWVQQDASSMPFYVHLKMYK